jgi:excisionase family DNA binding protein
MSRGSSGSGQPTSGLLTVREVAEILRCDATTIRRWLKNGAMQAIELPHPGTRMSYRIKRETLDTLLNTTAATA